MTLFTSLSLVLPFLTGLSQAKDTEAEAKPAAASTSHPEGLLFDRGPGIPRLFLPRDERLDYEVHLRLGFIETKVGTVRHTCEVKPYQRSVLLPTDGASEGDLETGLVTIHAMGAHSWYHLDSTLEARVLPQEWPQMTYRQSSQGTDKGRRELKIGVQEGTPTSSFRNDTKDGAPPGTRIWSKSTVRPVPAGSIDKLTSAYLARNLLREDLDSLTFPLVDKWSVWNMTIRRGESSTLETPAGTFRVVEILVEPEPYPGEEIPEKKLKRFEGLFGMESGFRLWVQEDTGVPVRMDGDLPIGPITIGIEVLLTGYRGTPLEFQPVQIAQIGER